MTTTVDVLPIIAPQAPDDATKESYLKNKRLKKILKSVVKADVRYVTVVSEASPSKRS
jgi:hypothetical protein